MARLNPAPLILGHVKGLSQRQYVGGKLTHMSPDWVARSVSAVVPLGAGGLVLLISPSPPVDGVGALGIALAWSALASAGLLSTFTLLAGWRERLAARADRDSVRYARDASLRSLIDEAVAHAMLGVLESLVVAAAAAFASITPAPWTEWAWAIAAAAGAHTVFLFGLIATRLYSAYVQAEDVPAEVDGSAGRSTQDFSKRN